MDYGKDTPNYTPIKTWYMLLALATIVKTGFMLKSLGFPQHLSHFLFLQFITLYSKHIILLRFIFVEKRIAKHIKEQRGKSNSNSKTLIRITHILYEQPSHPLLLPNSKYV